MALERNPLPYVAACLAATAIVGAAPASASSYYYFQSPSGNIACEMIGADDGTGAAVCKLRDHAWTAPATADGDCEFPGTDLKLSQGKLPCAGVWPSQIFGQQDAGGVPTLPYGQSHTAGAITCTSLVAGIRCTDAGTGHFFQVAQETYELG